MVENKISASIIACDRKASIAGINIHDPYSLDKYLIPNVQRTKYAVVLGFSILRVIGDTQALQ